MRFLSLLVILLTLIAESVIAQTRDFPYQAKVIVDEVFVRSGAGDSWLPTQRLQRDAVVTVHRHDPGGWYKIEPPEGSFSWIPSRFVRKLGESDGEVSENNVVAFVGSDFGDDTTVWQRRLVAGEKVRILAEQEIQTLSGKQSMYRIAPPRREFRWIQGNSLVPVDEQRRLQMDHDPYSVPSNAVRNNEGSSPGSSVASGVTDVPVVNPGSQLARLQQIRADQTRLSEIDQRFRDMIFQDRSTWDLDQIERDYQALQRETSYKPVAGQIDLRYPAIERYRRLYAEHMDIRRLTSQTEMKDAAIVARLNPRFGHPPVASPVAMQPSAELIAETPRLTESFAAFAAAEDQGTAFDPSRNGMIPEADRVPEGLTIGAVSPGQPWEFVGGAEDSPASAAETVSSVSDSLDTAVAADDADGSVKPIPVTAVSGSADAAASGLVIPVSASSEVRPEESESSGMREASASPAEAVRNRYVGAGVIQRSATAASSGPYILTTPSGKILAQLRAQGEVDLGQYVGQQVGLHGTRSFKEELKGDLIEVSSLEPVRIRR